MNLILIKASELTGDDNRSVVLDQADTRAKHILSHLRKRSGDEVSVGIVGGRKGQAMVRLPSPSSLQVDRPDNEDDNAINKVAKNASLTLELSFDGTTSAPASPNITLVLAIPQPKRLRALWSVIASMGVTRIVLIRAQLSPFGEHCKSSRFVESTYRPFIEEGMAQGAHVRHVEVNVDVDNVVSRETLESSGLVHLSANKPRVAKVFLDCGDESEMAVPPARDVVMKSCTAAATSCSGNDAERENNNATLHPPSAVLAVGPERGWTDSEASLFQEVGFGMASLGQSILRVDTAVVAGLAIVSAALDECWAATNDTPNAK